MHVPAMCMCVCRHLSIVDTSTTGLKKCVLIKLGRCPYFRGYKYIYYWDLRNCPGVRMLFRIDFLPLQQDAITRWSNNSITSFY